MKYLDIGILKLRLRSGIASLPAILLMGAIIVEIGVAGVFLISYLNNSVYGTRLSNQALIAARSGVNDAIWRVIRDKNCGSGGSCNTFAVSVGDTTADVTICKDICVTGKTQVVAIGHAFTKQRRVVAVLSVNSTTGLVNIDSIKDQP